jgi:hypothetical protein
MKSFWNGLDTYPVNCAVEFSCSSAMGFAVVEASAENDPRGH